jgi:glycine/D-amino acid oxidase-like deaminating enzyme
MGAGLLYHLALEGWTDIVLIEKGELTSGSTWHAAGQCPHFNSSLSMTRVHVYGTELYPKLEALTGHAVSWHGCGGIRLACTDEEVNWFKQVYGISKLAGYEAHIIGPDEIRNLHPFLEVGNIKVGFLTVTDGHVAPADVTIAMAMGARKLGAEVLRRTRVVDVKLLPSGEWRILTNEGDIVCEHVVNAAGSYCNVVGTWTGHKVPIANMLHHYVITEPVKELIEREQELPVIRDPWSHAYLREEANGILVHRDRACLLGRQPSSLGHRERAPRTRARPACPIPRTRHRTLPALRPGRAQERDLGRDHPHAQRRLPLGSGAGAAQLLDALRCLWRTVGSSRCEVSSAISQHTAVPTAWAPVPRSSLRRRLGCRRDG